MWLDGFSRDAEALFWQACGENEPFPRNLERPISLALPVALIKMPSLTIDNVESWLKKRGVKFGFGCQSRPIRGCVVAYQGGGMIFLDGVDPDDERRFTLAHEAAHFMLDYWLPRHLAIRKFGTGIIDVLDGRRCATTSERVHALLSGTPARAYTNFMERDESYGRFDPNLWSIESRADRLALALLAPPEIVLSEADTSSSRFEKRHLAVKSLLSSRFGLPTYVADSYAHGLLREAGLGPSWVENISTR